MVSWQTFISSLVMKLDFISQLSSKLKVESLDRSLKIKQFTRAHNSNHVISRIQGILSMQSDHGSCIQQEYSDVTEVESVSRNSKHNNWLQQRRLQGYYAGGIWNWEKLNCWSLINQFGNIFKKKKQSFHVIHDKTFDKEWNNNPWWTHSSIWIRDRWEIDQNNEDNFI